MPLAPFVSPAFVHKLVVNLTTEFLLTASSLSSPNALSLETLLAVVQLDTACMIAMGWLLAFTLSALYLIIFFFSEHAIIAV